ncbi:MAG: helix-turn-helix transcriptional regulator [Acidobacteriota bacterium]
MLGEALKLLRLFAGMQQSDLAEKLSISKSYLCELEGGKKEFSLALLSKYSELFNIPVSTMLIFAERMDGEKLSERSRVHLAGHVLQFLCHLQPDLKPEDSSDELVEAERR